MNVCILAAGMGTRMGSWGEALHKALLPLGNLGIISRIIAQFSPQDRYIIAVGHRKEQIQDYIHIAHPELNVTFVDVENYNGPGSGPGLSLYSCRKHLNEPFVFTSCDTLIMSALPKFDQNWMGVKEVQNIEKWCSVKVDQNQNVTGIYYKKPVDTLWAFVGIAYVKDAGDFWKGFEDNRNLMSGELQVNNGLEPLIARGLKAIPVEWEDTGNEENFKKVLAKFEPNYSFEGKSVDFTYRRGDLVIKFMHDPAISRRRYERAQHYRGIFAEVKDYQGHFFSYRYQPGSLLSAVNNAAETTKFLEWAETHLWRKTSTDPQVFADNNRFFYQQKSRDRLKNFCQKYLKQGEEHDIVINGLQCQTAEELINSIEDNFYKGGLSSTYHGDLHDDNILVTEDGYRLIDWRDAFGKLEESGDRYYDLAKYLHTLEFSVEAMANAEFKLIIQGAQLTAEHTTLERCLKAQESFWDFCRKYGYNRRQIEIIDALIFINMACFYEEALAKYLYVLGRYKLQQVLNSTSKNISYEHHHRS